MSKSPEQDPDFFPLGSKCLPMEQPGRGPLAFREAVAGGEDVKHEQELMREPS